MDSGLPVKDVGLSVDTGLSYSEDDYQGHRAASIYVGFQVPVVDRSGSNGHADNAHATSSGSNSPNQNNHRSSHHKSGHHKHRHHHHHHHHHHKRSGEKSSKSTDNTPSPPAEEPGGKDAPPSQRVQFILGGEGEDDDEHCPHQLFTEMDELRTDVDGVAEWKETARWVKFEEDVDEGGERWSKPHVATLSLHSLFELRNCLTKKTVLLDVEATSMETIANLIVEQPLNSSLTQEQKEKVIDHLVNLRHHHQHDKKPSGIRKESKGFRSLAEIGKKASIGGVPASATVPNLQAHKTSVGAKGIVDSSLKVQSSSQSNLDQMKSALKGQSPLTIKESPGGSGSIPVSPSEVTKMQDKMTANPSSFGSIKDFIHKSESQAKFNKAFMRKIPHGTEAHNVLVGEVDFLTEDQQIAAFLRLDKPVHFGNLTEVPIPTRFLFILLGGKQDDSQRFHEIGRSIATLMADELFHTVAYRAKNRADLLSGIDEFLDQVTVLPPGEWDPSIRIEPPPSVPSQKERMTSKLSSASLSNGDRKPGSDPVGSPIKEEEDPIDNWASMGLVKTGRLFGGLINDIRRKAPHYVSDYRDGLSIQCVASFFYLYFACLTPIVTFGGLLSDATGKNMGAIESLLSGVICGVIFNMFAGQPLSILGSTGPVLVFESITFQFCDTYELDYMSFRFWIGIWTAFILLLMVAFDLSYLVCYITRFTEESFATLIALIFIQKAFSKLFHIRDANAVHMGVDKLQLPFARESLSCSCVPKGFSPNSSSSTAAVAAALSSSLSSSNATAFLDNSTAAASSALTIPIDLTKYENVTFYECLKHLNGTVEPESCLEFKYVPDVFFLSVILFFGTFAMAFALKYSRNTGFFPTRVRVLLSDFSVIIAIVTFVLIDWSVSLPTPKLEVPFKFEPTNAGERDWVINPLKNEHWTIAAAVIPAMLATILIFMDQQITAVIVNRREHLLKKGCGYHLDLLLVGALIFVNSIFGLPWFVAATVLSITYVQSLRLESECAAPGEKPRFLGVRENRLTGVLIFTFIGVSVFMARVLRLIPMPVLYGVFLYMGVSSLKGIQLIDRLLLIFMPNKYQPDYMYLRNVRTKRVHFFTFFQVICLAALWVIKSFNETSILFPIMILALVGVRKMLELIFSKHELSELDDIMPEFHKKEEAEKLVSDVKEDGKPEEKDAKSDETDSFIKNKQRDINITDEICKTSNWKRLNGKSSDREKKSDNHKKHRNHHSSSRSRKNGTADVKRDPEA